MQRPAKGKRVAQLGELPIMAESGDGACVQAALLDAGQDPVAVRPL